MAIGRFTRLCRNGTMAALCKFRWFLACAASLLAGAQPFVIAAHAQTSHSWFDQQLEQKKAALLTHSQKESPRDQLLSIALLDDIYDLREHVSDSARVESVIAEIAASSSVASTVREEARNLSGAWNQSGQPNARVNGLVEWGNQCANQNDGDVQNALLSIELRHPTQQRDRAEMGGTAALGCVRLAAPETGTQARAPVPHAELANSPEAWYRASLIGADEYHRTQALHRALQLDPNYVPAVLAIARQHWAQGQLTRAQTLVGTALNSYPEESSLRELLVEMKIKRGHASSALVSMDELRAKMLPISVMHDLANDYAQLGFLDEARELAHRALKLNPNGGAERELALRLDGKADPTNPGENVNLNSVAEVSDTSSPALTESSNGDAESERVHRLLRGESLHNTDDTRSFANVSALIKNWRTLPAAERNESRILSDIRVDQLRSDYRAVEQSQQVIGIGSNADLAIYRTRSIQYSPETQELSVARARVHHADGRVVDAENLGESSVVDPSIAMYYDLRAREYRFRDLRVGDVIEVQYTISPIGNENPYGQYFAELIAFGGTLRCNLQRYILRVPSDIHLSSAEHLLRAPEIREANGDKVYEWQKKDIAALVREPRSPSWSEQGAYVHVSNFDSWQALGKWYRDLVQPQFALNAELENIVAHIVQQHPSRLDRVAAIDELVLRNTRYVALEFGIYGFKPYAVTQTFARGFGDCKDKASLMLALLRAAGIDAQIALVRTQRLGDIAPQPASASIFDHAIVYVPEFDLWLDGTAEFSRLRELPVDDQGVMALTIDADGNATLRRTPASTAADNYSRRTIDARMAIDGTIHFSGATYVRGEDAPELRRQLEPSDAKLGYIRDRLAQVLPAVEVRDVEVPQNMTGTVSLSFTGDLNAFHGRRGASLPSSWMERNYVATLSPTASRKQDLLLQAPWTTEEEIHIQLPQCAHVPELPKNEKVSSEFGTAEIEYRLNGEEIIVLSKVQFSATRIAAQQYSAFREFTTSLEEAFHRNIQVQLP